MSKLCIDSRLIGTDKHLVVDNGFWWSSHVPGGAWHLSGEVKDDSDRCLDTVIKLARSNIDIEPPKQFVNQMSLFTGSLGEPVPWKKVMPTRAHQDFVKRLVGQVMETMDTWPTNYYVSTWVPGNRVIGSLQRCSIDRSRYEMLLEKGEGNVSSIRSFFPDREGLACRVVYDRFKTLTGRLIVSAGPQILTLKKEHRDMMRSVHGSSGGIYALDFAALEARILLYEHGNKSDGVDLYGSIANELGYERKAIKAAVISKLYGSSRWALARHLGIEGNELNGFLRKFDSYFNTKRLLSRIKAQYVSIGSITNRYGRPITIDEPVDNLFISYYGQSTGVDVTMLGFEQILDSLKSSGSTARPVFLLHDSIFLDVHDDDLEIVKSIDHVRVKGYVQRFPLRLERIA